MREPVERDGRLAVTGLAQNEERPLGRELDGAPLGRIEIDVDERRRPPPLGARARLQPAG